jgi:hypothetical protein
LSIYTPSKLEKSYVQILNKWITLSLVLVEKHFYMIFGVLTTLSAIFQLYHGNQF